MFATHLRGIAPVLAATALFAAGCQGATGQPTTGAPSTGSAATTDSGPVQPKVNRVVMALEAPTTETNEPRHNGQPTMWQLKPMYEYLVGIDPNTSKLQPQLATDWKIDTDKLSVVFNLRKGVPFQKDGGTFEAKDVVFSMTELVKTDSQHAQAPYWRKIMRGVKALSDDQVQVDLAEPDGGFLRAISEAEATIEIKSKDFYEKFGEGTMQTQPVAGTGPYQYQARQQAQYLRYERTPYKHWSVTPDFPEFEFRFAKEGSTRLASLLTGEVHMASLPVDLQKQAETSKMKVVAGRSEGLRVFMSIRCCFILDPADHSKGMRYPDSPLADPRVRQALNKAINRDELNKAMFNGKGQTMVLNHFHPNREGWNPDWEKQFPQMYGYDPTAAKKLLADAGQSNLKTSIMLGTAAGVTNANDIAEAIAGYWKAIGVNVELQNIDPGEKQALSRQQKLSNHSEISGTSSALLFGSAVWNANVGRSSTYQSVEDPDVDDVLNDLYKQMDPAKQEPLFRKLGDLMYSKFMNINLFWLPAEMTVNPNVVADYLFPGSISGAWTHVYNIKAAR